MQSNMNKQPVISKEEQDPSAALLSRDKDVSRPTATETMKPKAAPPLALTVAGRASLSV